MRQTAAVPDTQEVVSQPVYPMPAFHDAWSDARDKLAVTVIVSVVSSAVCDVEPKT